MIRHFQTRIALVSHLVWSSLQMSLRPNSASVFAPWVTDAPEWNHFIFNGLIAISRTSFRPIWGTFAMSIADKNLVTKLVSDNVIGKVQEIQGDFPTLTQEEAGVSQSPCRCDFLQPFRPSLGIPVNDFSWIISIVIFCRIHTSIQSFWFTLDCFPWLRFLCFDPYRVCFQMRTHFEVMNISIILFVVKFHRKRHFSWRLDVINSVLRYVALKSPSLTFSLTISRCRVVLFM